MILLCGRWCQERGRDDAGKLQTACPVSSGVCRDKARQALRVGSTDGKVHGDYQFALANDNHEEDSINAGEHPVFLAAPPGAHEAQLVPYFLNTESSPTQVHCQRLCVASLLLAA